MKVPIAFLGTTPVVRKALKEMISCFSDDYQFSEETKGKTVDIEWLLSRYPDTKILFHPDFQLEGEEHFRIYLFWEVLSEEGFLHVDNDLFFEIMDSIFNELIKVPWGVPILLANGAVISDFRTASDDALRYFKSFINFLDQYQAASKAFSKQLIINPDQEYPFWMSPQNSFFRLMMTAGVPEHLFFNRESRPFLKEEIINWIHQYILKTDV